MRRTINALVVVSVNNTHVCSCIHTHLCLAVRFCGVFHFAGYLGTRRSLSVSEVSRHSLCCRSCNNAVIERKPSRLYVLGPSSLHVHVLVRINVFFNISTVGSSYSIHFISPYEYFTDYIFVNYNDYIHCLTLFAIISRIL